MIMRDTHAVIPALNPQVSKNSITNISNPFKDTRDKRYKSTCGAKMIMRDTHGVILALSPHISKKSITNISNLFKDTRDTRYKSTCGAKRHSRCHPGTQPSGPQRQSSTCFPPLPPVDIF